MTRIFDDGNQKLVNGRGNNGPATPRVAGRGPGAPSHELDRPLAALWRKRALIVSIAVFGTLLSGIALLYAPRTYTASVNIRIAPPEISDRSHQYLDEAVVDTHLAMLNSEANLGAALEHLDRIIAPQPASDDDPTGTRTEMSARIMALRSRLKIFQERRSHIITVAFTDESPARAAQTVDAVAETHITRLRNRVRDDAQGMLTHLGRAITQAGTELTRSEGAVKAYQVNHGLSDSGATDLTALVELRRELAQAQSILALRTLELGRRRPDPDDLNLKPQENGHPASRMPASAIEQLTFDRPSLRELADRRERYAPRPGNDVAAGVLLPGTTDHVELARQVDIATEHVQLLRQHLAIAQSIAAAGSDKRAELFVLERKAATSSKIYEELLRRRQNIEERVRTTPIDASIVAQAVVPAMPSSIDPLLLLPPAFLAFLALGITAGLAADRLDGGLRGEALVESVLGIRCLGRSLAGSSDEIKPGLHDLYTPAGRSIREIFDAATGGDRTSSTATVLAVTSSIPGEGAAQLAADLTACASWLGQRTLLLNLEPTTELDSAPFPYLAGRAIGQEPAKLSRSGLLEALRPLCDEHQCIIILAPPVLASADVRIIASIADLTLLAVRWGATRRGLVSYALERLESGAVSLERETLAAVLTCAPPNQLLAAGLAPASARISNASPPDEQKQNANQNTKRRDRSAAMPELT